MLGSQEREDDAYRVQRGEGLHREDIHMTNSGNNSVK